MFSNFKNYNIFISGAYGYIGSEISRKLCELGAHVFINGRDKNKLNTFIRNMPARDSLKLRKYIDQNEPGIEMKSWMDCPHCEATSEVRLPMGASFFWPDSE